MKIVRSDSRQGRKLLERLVHRGDDLLDGDVLGRAGKIVDSVRRGGDRALLEAVRRYDRSPARSIDDLCLAVPEEVDGLAPGIEEALERAIARVERFHERQVHPGYWMAENGVELVERRAPFGRVGVYVPGGRAAYPSTAVMTVVPARLAGVEEIVVVTPPLAWEASGALRFVLGRLGVTEVWGMGGAQAVAALAHGTESVRRVDKIVGPGNAWVTAAKHLVSADVAIDGLAGPSEVVVVADGGADPALVAADLLAQAEHDPRALALLVTDRRKLAKQVSAEVDRQLADLPTAAVAKQALEAVLLVADMDEALDVAQRVAPEHLQLIGTGAEALAERATMASAVFVGAGSPVVFGDYLAGPSHVLPTAGTARFSSALGVEDFVRRSHVVRLDDGAARRLAGAAATLADAEGLPAHAASARRRLGGES
ncbi:MAG: histidinol dehydrogenase [bacterium]|nr:histidinol dehydrogenase [bacterium]